MRRYRIASLVNLALVLLVASAAQAGRGVRPVVTSAGMDFQVAAEHGALTLAVSTPDGIVWQRTFRAEEPVSFALFDARGDRLPDGEYRWEIVAAPRTAATRAADGVAGKATGNGWIESGAFRVIDGAVLGEIAEPARTKPEAKMQDPGNKDVVTADDEIIQGSLCVGLDCVVNENFGFDTIRLKENNTRIKFDDTSTSTGFPNHDWQLTANDSPSGGANKFSIEDISASTVPFTVSGSAPTNSLFVDSSGRVGLGTSAPVLKLSLLQGDTPAIRLEQTAASGFTAQTWDIAGNEANFFVRDVTGGSRLPLRIRPGAPTSSIDINAEGNVGIGTASPGAKLHVFGTATSDAFVGMGDNIASGPALNFGYAGASFGRSAGFFNIRPDASAVAPNPSIRFMTVNVERMIIDNEGFIGLGGVANPSSPIQHSNGALLTAGGAWQNGSSRALKQDISQLSPSEALAAVAALQPVKFAYKAAPAEHHVGFIAEDVPDLVASTDRQSLGSMDIVAVLTRVVQEQQATIEKLAARLAELERQQRQEK